MKAKFLETISKYNMLSTGDRVVVGVSGGADSMCLLSLLIDCSKELDITVEAAHVNHLIRDEEAFRDADFVKSFCKEKHITLHDIEINIPEAAALTGESIELCARKKRYDFFSSINADKIATAHTGSDRIETLLMNFSRGSTLNGLASIPPVRDNIIRPLINFTRADIENYCKHNNISFVIDSSNLEDEYTRNKYRHKIITNLAEINPSFELNAIRCIENINFDNDYITSVALSVMKSCLDENNALTLTGLKNQHTAIVNRVIALYINNVINSDFENKHIKFITENLNNKFSLTLPGGHILNSDGVLLHKKNSKNTYEDIGEIIFSKFSSFKYEYGNRIISVFRSSELYENEETVFIADFDKISDNICLRTRKEGDLFHYRNSGYTKTLKKLFNEFKVPVELRNKLFILSDDNGLIFIENFGIDSKRKITENSKEYLIIKLECVKNE